MPALSIRKYRLTGPDEPSDLMMSRLMKSACEQAQAQAQEAQCAYFDELSALVDETLDAWNLQTEDRA